MPLFAKLIYKIDNFPYSLFLMDMEVILL